MQDSLPFDKKLGNSPTRKAKEAMDMVEANRRYAVQNLIKVTGIADLDGGTFANALLENSAYDVSRAWNIILTELQKRNLPI